ncbi:transcription-repair coupling factor [Salinispira pacifica]
MITLFYNRITESLKSYRPYKELMHLYTSRSFPLDIYGPHGSFLALIMARMASQTMHPMLIVVPTEQEAEQLIEDLRLFGAKPHLFPWWGIVPYRPVPTNSALFGRRMQVLAQLVLGQRTLVVTSLRAFLTPVPPPDYLRDKIFTVSRSHKFDIVALGDMLERYGYLRVPKVTVRGEYALRGEVLDVFVPGADGPFRTVFEFDRVEEIKQFDPATQASTGRLSEFQIYPLKEVVWHSDELAALERRIEDLPEFRSRPDALEELQVRGYTEGEELFYPLAFERAGTILDYLGGLSPVLLAEYDRLLTGAETLAKEYDTLFRRAKVERPVPRPERVLLDFGSMESAIVSRIRFPILKDAHGSDGHNEQACHFHVDPPRSFFGNITFLREELANFTAAGYQIYVFADGQSQADRIGHLLSEYNVSVLPESISAGFTLPDQKIMVIEEGEIFGRRKRVPKSVKQAQSAAIDTFVDLSPGDHVVHVNYGIGRFKGIQRIKAAGNERDYIHLEYAGDEFVYIPIEQVNLIQRYIGHGDGEPRLDKLGGKAWENRKSKVRQNVEDLAERLISLYSKRKRVRGFAFPADTEWQFQFEATFPYEETEDQTRCIEEVKADMESPYPMDRLVCGDVGYGKTEIAMRAAFKAVSAGKQAAILAPTTILVEQHFENFEERMRPFPVKIAMLSRFVSPKEQKAALEGLREGSVDLVIGTHRLLQRDVKFKNLGLMVVDEEQRFGVKDKERLKELKTNVDSLTLTATPIPRTLHMSLLKIRDMSVLKTPPHNRLPIETIIQEFNEELIAQAIRNEMARGGQVYFLHNRVETLNHVRMFVERLVPECLVETAHGKMSGQDLEDIMHRFIHGAFQVLVSTTIIENGIDIPNVNTIIIDRADMYGISQLYQLRGRVGRSGKLAYAYLFYPGERALSEIAMKRLQVISDYTELGSGFKIALKDLEVRGAGNLLGPQQSGDILSVGFDLYLKLLDEAIRRLDENEEELPPEVYLELEYSGFIPDSYISEPIEKMEVYKRIASIVTDEELDAVFTELEDRFGPLPDEVQSLLSLAEIRIMCRKLLISSMRERKGRLEIEFSKVAAVSADKIVKVIETGGGSISLDPRRPNVLFMNTTSVGLKEKSEFIRGRLSALV